MKEDVKRRLERFEKYVRSLNLTQKKGWARDLRAFAKRTIEYRKKVAARNEKPEVVKELRLANLDVMEKLCEAIADELETQSVAGEEGLIVFLAWTEDVGIMLKREKYKKRYIT